MHLGQQAATAGGPWPPNTHCIHSIHRPWLGEALDVSASGSCLTLDIGLYGLLKGHYRRACSCMSTALHIVWICASSGSDWRDDQLCCGSAGPIGVRSLISPAVLETCTHDMVCSEQAATAEAEGISRRDSCPAITRDAQAA